MVTGRCRVGGVVSSRYPVLERVLVIRTWAVSLNSFAWTWRSVNGRGNARCEGVAV